MKMSRVRFLPRALRLSGALTPPQRYDGAGHATKVYSSAVTEALVPSGVVT